jgi:hypothetical protein
MKHLEDEDIGRLIDGNIDKKERDEFLKHLSECESCVSIYTETLKFVEEEKKNKPKLKILRGAGEIITGKRYRWALAAAIIILVIGTPFLLNYLSFIRIRNVRVQYIEASFYEIENRGIQAFSSSNDPFYAAVRAGIFAADHSIILDTDSHPELKSKIGVMMNQQLKIANNAKNSAQLFKFGHTVEQGVLLSFEKKRLDQKKIDYLRLISREYKDILPWGVIKSLDKIKPGAGVAEFKEILLSIKDVFLASD